MKILICSKYKYQDRWAEVKATLESRGHKCTTPLDIDIALFGKDGTKLSESEYLAGVQEFYRILKESDLLYVLNYEGEFGKSMMQEIGYAAALGKEIFALESLEQEPSLELFIKKIIKPEEI